LGRRATKTNKQTNKYFLTQDVKFAFAPQYVEEEVINHMYWQHCYLTERLV
jgi:hypothetical protein